MENINKKVILRGVILVALALCITFGAHFKTSMVNNIELHPHIENTTTIPFTSQIPHDPIQIDGNIALEAFCAGNETDGLSWETAFTIEYYSISNGEDYGIYINNTDKYLIINNCTIENFDENWNTDNGVDEGKGINIQNCSNVKITNCFLQNNVYGIYLNSSISNFILENNCSSNEYGYTLVNSENNSVFNNIASNNDYNGFELLGSSQNNISNNYVYDNYYTGFYLFQDSIENLICNNLINNNTDGIWITESCCNTIRENTISNHSQGYGIAIEGYFELHLEQDIYDNFFENNMDNIMYFDFTTDLSYHLSGWEIVFIIFIGLIIAIPIFLVIFRKKIKLRWNYFISNREIKKSKLKNDRAKRTDKINSETSKNSVKNIDREDSKSKELVIYKLLKVIGWFCALSIIFLFIGFTFGTGDPYFLIDIPILIMLFLLNRKKIKYQWNKFNTARESELKIDKAKEAKNNSIKSSKPFVENIDREDSKLSWLDIYISLKIIGWICVLFTMVVLIIESFNADGPLFLIDIPILIMLFLLNRKKITKRWKKLIIERSIIKNERKRKNELKWNESKINYKRFYKIIKSVGWGIIFVLMEFILAFSCYDAGPFIAINILVVIIILISYRKRINYSRKRLKCKILIGISQYRTYKAIKHAKIHNYKRSRMYWSSSERNYHRALRITPDFIKMEYIERRIQLVKQNITATYLSEGLFLSKLGLVNFQKARYPQAKKYYAKAITIVEKVLKYIETEETLNEENNFPIKVTLVFEILQFLRKNLEQIEIEENYRKKKKSRKNSISLQEINEKITVSIKEVSETLWIYSQTLDSRENILELEDLSDILSKKLTKSVILLNSVQERMQYLLGYMQASGIRYDGNGIGTKSVAKNINKIIEQEKIENIHLKIIREYEYIGGKIRFKVGIVNHSGNVLTNLALRFDLPESLKWIIHEPNFKRRGDTIHIAKLGGNEKIAISLYLEPVNCLESSINATLTYFDARDHPQAIIMTPKKVSITCPIFFTREEANLARVKKIQLQLKYEDRKIFPLVNSEKSELIFNKILESIGKHDIKLVHKEYSRDQNKGEAFYYGITKVNKKKMVIHLLSELNHHIIEIAVNGDEQEPITGLLAELESQIRDKLIVHNIIEGTDKFNDINTSVLLGNCPYCNGPISPERISFFKNGETIKCKYCDTAVIPY